MTLPFITLMNAYTIEQLLAQGIQKDSLIQALKSKNLEQLKSFDSRIDYTYLLQSFDKNSETLENAIKNNYTVTYLTKGGLKNLLQIKYGFKEQQDFSLSEFRLDDLTVTTAQLGEISILVGSVWNIQPLKDNKNGTHTISIIHGSQID